MIEVQVKANPSLVFYYEDFNQFEIHIREWHRARINSQSSAMQYVLDNYNINFYGYNLVQ